MPSETYRYYRLDSMGSVHLADWIDAEKDDDAIAFVETTHPDSKCEIWQGTRLVATTSPIRRQA